MEKNIEKDEEKYEKVEAELRAKILELNNRLATVEQSIMKLSHDYNRHVVGLHIDK